MNPLELTRARVMAARIAAELQPFCTRLEVAGSIRRGRPWVNDIDLVVIPRHGEQGCAALRARVLKNSTPIQDGPLNLLVRLQNGVQLDIFIAHDGRRDLISQIPSNFGSLLLCRTGSKEHNVKLANRALELGLKWKIYEGIFSNSGPSGELIASATEQEIFATLKMDFMEPQNRS